MSHLHHTGFSSRPPPSSPPSPPRWPMAPTEIACWPSLVTITANQPTKWPPCTHNDNMWLLTWHKGDTTQEWQTRRRGGEEGTRNKETGWWPHHDDVATLQVCTDSSPSTHHLTLKTHHRNGVERVPTHVGHRTGAHPLWPSDEHPSHPRWMSTRRSPTLDVEPASTPPP